MMENNEITEARLIASNWSKVGNTFYKNKKAITHFDGRFQVWLNGEYHQIKTMQEIRFYVGEIEGIKKPG